MKIQKKNIIIGALLATLLLATVVNGAVGSDDDPLISLSYIENVVMPYIDQAMGNTGGGYKVVELKKGQSLVADASCEIILRSGDCAVVIPSSAGGGFTDITAGRDSVNGEKVIANHLYICPRSDGRKMKASSSTVYFMVRGSYDIT